MAGLYNKTAGAQVDAWIAGEIAETSAAIRSEVSYWDALIEGMADHLDSLQEAVMGERGLWNMIAGGAGCVLGGIAGGLAGGPQGAMQGCKTGSKVTTLAADYVYDSDKWDTPKETNMKEYANEFENLDINLSEVAKRFTKLGGYEAEKRLEDFHEDYWTDYEEFEEGFYGKEGYDYMNEFIATGIDFFGSPGYAKMTTDDPEQDPTEDFVGDYDQPIGPPIGPPLPGSDEVGAPIYYDQPLGDTYYNPYNQTAPYAPGFSPQDTLSPNQWASSQTLMASSDMETHLDVIGESNPYDLWNYPNLLDEWYYKGTN